MKTLIKQDLSEDAWSTREQQSSFSWVLRFTSCSWLCAINLTHFYQIYTGPFWGLLNSPPLSCTLSSLVEFPGESPADFWFLGMRYLSKPFLRKNYSEWLFSQLQIFMWRVLSRQAVFLIEHDWAKQKYPHLSHPLSQPKTSETKENIVNIVLRFCRPVAREVTFERVLLPWSEGDGDFDVSLIFLPDWFALRGSVDVSSFSHRAIQSTKHTSGLNCPPNVSSFIPYNIFHPVIITQMFLCNLTSNHNSETLRANFCCGNMSVSLTERKLSFPYLVIDLILKESWI